MPDDPTVSAVVAMRPPPGDEERSAATAIDQRLLSKVKTHFSHAGFEVHAPFGTTFSVGGKASLFHEVFGVTVQVDEESLPAALRLEGGGHELPLDRLPEEIRSQLESISFVPPPDLGSYGA